MAARAARSSYEELARHLRAIGAVKREMARGLPSDCPPAAAAVLALLRLHGEMRTSQLSELMAVDMSVTSRHVAHNAAQGWIERRPDPMDGRSRLLRLTEQGHEQLQRLTEATTETLQSHMHDWTDEDIAQLNRMLDRLCVSFGEGAARAPRETAAGGDVHRPRPGEQHHRHPHDQHHEHDQHDQHDENHRHDHRTPHGPSHDGAAAQDLTRA